jgi:hypothetical protein
VDFLARHLLTPPIAAIGMALLSSLFTLLLPEIVDSGGGDYYHPIFEQMNTG